MPKIGRNDPCPCNSGKKYKKCCIGKDFKKKDELRQRIIYGDEYVSESLEMYANKLKDQFPYHEVIDVSRVVTNDTYKPLQLQHFKSKVVMLVERMPDNEEVFAKRIPFESIRYMVMYRGAYQCFEIDEKGRPEFEQVIKMIETRDADEVWEEN